MNIGPLPQSLAGKGTVSIVVRADGQSANAVNAAIQWRLASRLCGFLLQVELTPPLCEALR